MTSLVLISGGLDSAVLLADEATRADVQPVYVSVGLWWESAEQQMLARLLAARPFVPRVRPLLGVHFDMRDVYPPSHWALTGAPPDYDSPDEAVYLTGRNLVLLTKAGVLAATIRASRIVLGTLSGNPFPDATPHFLCSMSETLSLGLGQAIEVATPLGDCSKAEVIRLGLRLEVPLRDTLSCMRPEAGDPPRHCGLCSKCRERRDAFHDAAVPDPTSYAAASPR